ncbi:MAG: GNAT family N-acetyltransferase, partial [Lachnospiraceae bacterium]
MERLNENEMVRIQPLFEGREETMIQSCFQGIMGTAWADDRRQIGCAAIILGDFCYFAGRPDLRFAAGQKLKNILNEKFNPEHPD